MKNLLVFVVYLFAINTLAQDLDIKWSKPVKSKFNKFTDLGVLTPEGKYLYIHRSPEFPGRITNGFGLIEPGEYPWLADEDFVLYDPETLEEINQTNWKNALKELPDYKQYKGYKLKRCFGNKNEITWVLKKSKTINDETVAIFKTDPEGKAIGKPTEVHTMQGLKPGGGALGTSFKFEEQTGKILLLNEVEGSQGNIKLKLKLLGPTNDILDVGEMELPFEWDRMNPGTRGDFVWEDNYVVYSEPVKEKIGGTKWKPVELFSHLISIYSFKDGVGRNFLLKMEDRTFSSIEVKTSNDEVSVWACYAMKDENDESKEITGLFNAKLDFATGEFMDVKFIPFSPEFYDRFKNVHAGKTFEKRVDAEIAHHVTGIKIVDVYERGEDLVFLCYIQKEIVYPHGSTERRVMHNRDIFSIVLNKYNEMEKISSFERTTIYYSRESDILVAPLSGGRKLILYDNDYVRVETESDIDIKPNEALPKLNEITYAIMHPDGEFSHGKIEIDNSQNPAELQLKHRNYFFKFNDNVYVQGEYGEKEKKIFALGKFIEKQ